MNTQTATFWLSVVAGLGVGTLIGTLLAGLISSSIAARQREHERLMREADHEHERKLREAADAAQRRRERAEAYREFLTTSAMVLHEGGVLRSIVQLRSGSTESVGIASSPGPSFHHVEFDNLLRQDYEPLVRAWTNVWLVGSAAAIDQANRLLNVATEVTAMGVSRGRAREGLPRLAIGEKWTKAQATAWQDALRAIRVARKEFAEVARRELGNEFAEVFMAEGEPTAAAKSVPLAPPEPEAAAKSAPLVPPEPEAAAKSGQLAPAEPDQAAAELEPTSPVPRRLAPARGRVR